MLQILKGAFQLIISSMSDLRRPKMLALCFGPVVLGLGLWFGVILFSWPQLVSFFSASSWLYLLLAVLGLLVLLPALAVTGLAVTSVVAMPVIVAYVHREYFPKLEKRKGYGLVASTKNAAKFWLLYMVLLVMSLPSWLIPILGVGVSLGLNTFVNRRILYFDSMSEIADIEEFKALDREKSKELWGLALAIALCMMIPGYFLIAPVHAGIVFTRYAMEILQERRARSSSASPLKG